MIPQPTNTATQSRLESSLRGLVPLAAGLDFRIQTLSPREVVCSLEANDLGLNQNGTLQAATFYILADYTSGLAGYAGLGDYSLLGMDDPQDPRPKIQGWLKDGYVKHIRPATGSLRAVAALPEEEIARIRQDLSTSGKCVYTAEIQIFQETTLVAIARHTVVFMATSH